MGLSSLLASLPSTPLSGLFAPSSSSLSQGARSPKGKLRLLDPTDDGLLDEVDLVESSAAASEEERAVCRVELRIEGM